MPSAIDSLKAELLRLAAKQAESQISKFRKTAAESRREVAQLKRLLRQKEREIAHLKKQQQAPADENPLVGVRFSPKSVRSQRKRLGLSAQQYGKLVGVSALTVLHWEAGQARPRRKQLAALVAVRNISKTEALRRLAK